MSSSDQIKNLLCRARDKTRSLGEYLTIPTAELSSGSLVILASKAQAIVEALERAADLSRKAEHEASQLDLPGLSSP